MIYLPNPLSPFPFPLTYMTTYTKKPSQFNYTYSYSYSYLLTPPPQTHEVNLDGRGYAFPYDDVVPSGDAGPDQAGTVFDANPELLTVTIGGPASGSDGPGNGGKEKDGGDKTKTPSTTPAWLSKLKSLLGALKKMLHIK